MDVAVKPRKSAEKHRGSGYPVLEPAVFNINSLALIKTGLGANQHLFPRRRSVPCHPSHRSKRSHKFYAYPAGTPKIANWL
jgi:hypothetical protein